MAECVVVLSDPGAQCATFFWGDRSDLYVGYRFIEHRPETSPEPLAGIDDLPACRRPADMPAGGDPLPAGRADPFGKGWRAQYDQPDAHDPIQLRFRSFAGGSARARGLDSGGRVERQFFFRPAEDGVDMWMRLTTHVAAPGACAVQQCLRFSGETAQEWRRPIACVRPLSEFDLQARGCPNETLTWARRGGRWLRFPVPATKLHTPPGARLLGRGSDGRVDHGLILREARDGSCAAGMYWERTAYVSNRHPADCVHAVVDFGPLAAGESRTVRGKFYFIEGAKDDLLSAWRGQFAGE